MSGEWTLKDVIAHISWYEREIAHMLQIRSYTEASEWWGLPNAEQNAHIYALNRDRSLPDILAESQTSYADLLAAIETVSDDDLNDASRFAESPPGAMPWEIIAQNSHEHYQHHTRDLQAWLERTS